MLRTVSIAILCLIPLSACAQQGEMQNGQEVIAFVNVHVLPMSSETVLSDQTVLVSDGRIIETGPAAEVRIPQGAQQIMADGKFLMPGLAEMHGHVPPPSAGQQYIENVLFLYLANGITTVRGMLGWPGQLALRERANRGDLDSPRLFLAGPSFNGQSVNSPPEAIQKVKDQVTEGWDLLKVHPGLTIEEYDAMASTADAEDIRFGGHVPAAVGLLHAIESGQETFDHLDGFIEYLDGTAGPIDEFALQEVIAKTVKSGASVVPTMALWETLYAISDLDELNSFDELKYMPAHEVQQWENAVRGRAASGLLSASQKFFLVENRKKVLFALFEAGVPVLMGTDAPQLYSVPGFSIHRELPVMVAAGMTRFQILQTGTVNVGKYFASKGLTGTISVGAPADLVLLDRNPLEDLENLRNPAGVMIQGRWIDGETIRARLDRIAGQNQ